MSQTTTTELQDRAETITTHLDEIATPASNDASAVEGGITRQEIEQRLDDRSPTASQRTKQCGQSSGDS